MTEKRTWSEPEKEEYWIAHAGNLGFLSVWNVFGCIELVAAAVNFWLAGYRMVSGAAFPFHSLLSGTVFLVLAVLFLYIGRTGRTREPW